MSATTCPKRCAMTSGHRGDPIVISCDLPAGHTEPVTMGDVEHTGPGLPANPGQRVSWLEGDRRTFTGQYPGPCPGERGRCVLYVGHRGRCAP